jgi:two-component system, LuxR family, sensor kinase FixL
LWAVVLPALINAVVSFQGEFMAEADSPASELMTEPILRDILESVNDAVITVDVHQRICFFNAKAEEIFGYQREEALGQNLKMLLINEYQERHHEFLRRCLEHGFAGRGGMTIECTGLRKDGSHFPLEKSYSHHQANGQSYFTAVIRDISARLDLERKLRFAERHADVGKAIAHVVHEIRNPLMLIGGFGRQLERSPALQKDAKSLKKLHIIVTEIQRLEELLEGVLLLRRPASAAKKSRLNIHDVLNETCRMLEPRLAGKSVQLRLEFCPQPVEIDADPDQIKQVLLNLLYNALDAMEETGTISIGSTTTATTVQIRIHDTGPGIPEQVRSRIFDPFFTTKAHGTGLGLAISRNIIQDHGGTIQVGCPINDGTTFTIELPLASADG